MSKESQLLDEIDETIQNLERGDNIDQIMAEDLKKERKVHFANIQDNLMSQTTLDTDQIDRIRNADIDQMNTTLSLFKLQANRYQNKKTEKMMDRFKIVFLVLLVMFIIYLIYNSRWFNNTVDVPDISNISNTLNTDNTHVVDKLSSFSYHGQPNLGGYIPFNFPSGPLY